MTLLISADGCWSEDICCWITAISYARMDNMISCSFRGKVNNWLSSIFVLGLQRRCWHDR